MMFIKDKNPKDNVRVAIELAEREIAEWQEFLKEARKRLKLLNAKTTKNVGKTK